MIIGTIESLDQCLNWIELQEEIVIDIETTGLNVRSDTIIGFGITDSEGEGYYIAHKQFLEGELKTVLDKDSCIHVLKQLEGKNLVTFNGDFDLPFIKHYFGVDLIPSLWADTLLAKHTADEEYPFKLKDIGKKLFGVEATEEQTEMLASIKANGGSGKNEMYKCDLDIMAKYCIKDCQLTGLILKHYLQKLKQQELLDFFFKDEVMPLYKEVTIPMEQGGIPLDMPLIESSQTEINADISRIENEIQEEIKPHLDNFTTWYLNKEYPVRRTGAFGQQVASYFKLPLPKTKAGAYSLSSRALESLVDSPAKQFLIDNTPLHPRDRRLIQEQLLATEDGDYIFNLSSKHHLKKLFFEELGEKAISYTELGNPQVDDLFLDKMAAKYNWASLLRDYNKLIKLRGTYIERLLDKQEDGIFYPSFFQHRTVSGRYGSDLQQLPRPASEGNLSPVVLKYNNRIRKFFIAGEGNVFIDVDYESLEPHVFAHVSGDDGLRDIFRRGDDFYSTIAIQTEKIEGLSANKKAENYLGKVEPDRRQKAKAYSLGIPYGMTAYKLQFEIEVGIQEAERLVKQYLEAYPDLNNWMDDSVQQAITKGYVRSEAGRIRHMPEARRIIKEYGIGILDSLQLWKDYNENPGMYTKMKKIRKRLSNYLNNARNFQIQSLSASIVNRAAITINRYMKSRNIPGHVCAQIHDQLIIKTTKEHGARMQGAVQEIMENNYRLSINLKAPAEIAENFADGH